MARRFSIGVRGRLFGALALTGLMALGIGLGAHEAFNRLRIGITEVTAERFPAVVASARLERQHQRIMRTLRELAAAVDNLERETIGQGLFDQLAGYERLLDELPHTEGRDADQVAHLRAGHAEVKALRAAIDDRVTQRAQAARAVRDLDRLILRQADALGETGLHDHPDPAVQRWLADTNRSLFLLASVHRVENRFALARLTEEAGRTLARARETTVSLPADVANRARRTLETLTKLSAGPDSVFAQRQRQLEATEGLGGLLERANQVSLLITGLTSSIFVEQTTLAEESRHALLVITDDQTRLFLGASLVVALVGLISLVHVQRSIVARLWAVRDALRQRADGVDRAIPTGGADEIGELARALDYHIRQTEEKTEALRRNERWFRATLEAAPVPIAIAALDDGVTRFVNRRGAELLGTRDGRALIGRPIAALWRSPIVWEGFVDEIVKHAVAVDLETELVAESGSILWGLVSGTVIEFEGEQVLLVAMVDITRRRQAESLARQTQNELREAKERAERADATKTEFLATLSHEMRTPLNGILGLGRLLLTGPLDETERRHVRSIMRCGGGLLDQVNDILDLRKIEDGKLDLDPVPCLMRSFLDDVLVAVASTAEEKAIGLDLRAAPDLPEMVVIDPQRLRQIVVNLVGNAVKFTERGGVTVAVGRDEDKVGDETGAPWLVIRVRDTGIGIPPDRQAAIFEKLEQGDPSISRRFGGTGLGLAIARQLAQAMGGDIGVDSQVGLGSTFTLRVPLVVANPADELAGAVVPTPDLAMPPTRLLLVEDDAVNREVALGLLGGAGHTVVVAETGAQAVERAALGGYDAILLDMRLPDFDGVEVARRVRALPDQKAADVPIIAVTANVFATDRARYVEAGVDAVVEKPIFPEKLARALMTLTGRRGEGVFVGVIGPEKPMAGEPNPGGGEVERVAIDTGVLARYHAALGPARFQSIRGLLVESVTEGLERLAAPDIADNEVAEIAHRLAGAGGHFGLTGFVALMRGIEDEARAGHRSKAVAMITRAPGQFTAALAAMDGWRDGLEG